MAQQYAKAMGLKVIAIDTGDEKRKMCLEQLGSQAFVDFGTSKDVVQDVKDATEDGLGPHAVILVAVNEKPFQQAAEVCITFQYLETLLKLTISPVRSSSRFGGLYRSTRRGLLEGSSV